MKDDIPIEQEDRETSSDLLQLPKGSIHVIILVNFIIVFTIKIFSIKKLTAICVILSLTCPIVSSLVYLLAFLGIRNDIHTGIVVSNEIAVQILGNEYCYISHMGSKSRVTILGEQDMG